MDNPYSSNQKRVLFHERMLAKSAESDNKVRKAMDLDFRSMAAVQGDWHLSAWTGGIHRTDVVSQIPTPGFLGFPCGSAGKESACSVGDLGSIPGLGRSPGGGKGCPLQHPGLENSTDCIDRGVAKSRTRLSNSHFHRYPLVFPHTCNQIKSKH